MKSNEGLIVGAFREGDTLGLHQRVSRDLQGSFSENFVPARTVEFAPDCVIQQGDRAAVIEIKTGDPGIPLPSSSNTRMQMLKNSAQKALKTMGVKHVVPVLVTNYLLDDVDRKELESGGTQIIQIEDSNYDSKAFSKRVQDIVAG